MNNELPIPYQDFLCVKPYEKKSVLVSDKNSLLTYGEVLTKGPQATQTELNDWVAFELQDKPEFISKDGTIYHFVKERDCMCKLDPKSSLFFYDMGL